MNEKKIVHLQIVGGEHQDIVNIGKAINIMKEATHDKYEFLITNEHVQLRDVKYLIKELYELYKLQKEE